MKKNSKKKLLPTKYELMVLQYIQDHLHIYSISQLILSYIRFNGIINSTQQPYFDHDCVTPLLDGKLAYYCLKTYKLKIWNTETNKVEQEFQLPQQIVVIDMKLLKDGRLVIYYSTLILIMNPYTGNYEDGIELKNNKIYEVKIMNEDIIMIIMSNNNIHRWNITTGQYESIDIIPSDLVYIDILSVHKIVTSSFTDFQKIDIVDLQTGQVTTSTDTHDDHISRICVLPNEYIMSSCMYNIMKIWKVDDTGSIICLLTLIGHIDFISHVTLLPDGRLVSSSYDRTLKIWNLETGICELTLDSGRKDGTSSLSVLPDGGLLSCFDFTNYVLWI